MVNLIAFVNMFLSYLLVFACFVVVIVSGFFIGKKIRKNKDAKLLMEKEQEDQNQTV